MSDVRRLAEDRRLRFAFWERFLVLNCYGTALFVAGLVLAVALDPFRARFGIPPAIWLIASVGIEIALLAWGSFVSARYPRRARIARALIARVERHGFKREYFENTCGELCMRKVTWLVLRRVGASGDFAAVVRAYGGRRGSYIEHSNPELENLINSGLVTRAQVAQAIERGLARGL